MYTVILLNPDVLQPAHVSPEELALWADVAGDIRPAPMQMVREERLDWLAMASPIERLRTVLLGDHASPRCKDLDLRSVVTGEDMAPRLGGEIYSAADVPAGVRFRAESIISVARTQPLFPPGTPWAQRQIVWADSDLGDRATCSVVRAKFSLIAATTVLIEPSRSYGLLPADLWQMSRAVGMCLPSHGFNAPPPGPPAVDHGKLF